MNKTLPKSLQDKLDQRAAGHALRQLSGENGLVDFSSNDYLGFAKNEAIFSGAARLLTDLALRHNGATGSRLISGNHTLYELAETEIAAFHHSQAALLFNSGYDANVGFFSSVPQRGDVILFDELCHASIRDGIRLSPAKAFKFPHNDTEALEALLSKQQAGNIYVATESVFSMDGDAPNLEKMVSICESHQAFFVVDEAHALGVFGDSGEGLSQALGIHDRIFARIMTFGKGLGCHGAAILGGEALKTYLINFARSFIYTTGLPPHSVATAVCAYRQLQDSQAAREQLRANIAHFNQEKMRLGLKPVFVYGKSAIQSAVIPGNEKVKSVAAALQEKGFGVKAVLSPTVPAGQERLRICLHAYDRTTDITALLETLAASL